MADATRVARGRLRAGLGWGAFGACVALVAAGLSLDWPGPSTEDALGEGLRVVRAALLTGTGVLLLVEWRVTDRARAGMLGLALLVLGVLAESLTAMAPEGSSHPVSSRLAWVTASLAAAVLLLWARHVPSHAAGETRGPWVLLAAAMVPVVALAAVLLGSPWAHRVDESVPLWLPALVTAGLWSSLAVSEWRFGPFRESLWLVVLLGGLALGSAVSVSVRLGVPGLDGVAPLVTTVASAVAVGGAWRRLRSCLEAQREELMQLQATLLDRDHETSCRTAQDEERLHELRSLLAGIHGASATLRHPDLVLDPHSRRRLEDAVAAELRRLAHLVDPEQVDPVVDLDLAESLAAVVVSARAQGQQVEVRLDGQRAVARAGDLATAVCALLVNAQRHAPGASVTITAARGSDRVHLRVTDDGPGIGEVERATVFQRGVRGRTGGPGTGLGLFTVARLVSSMSGHVRLESPVGGGTSVVLDLPAPEAIDRTIVLPAPAEGSARREVTLREGDRPVVKGSGWFV